MTAAIHDERVKDRRGRTNRLLARFRHRHHVVRRTWTMDDTPWHADPNALDYCECGAHRHLWRGGTWTDA